MSNLKECLPVRSFTLDISIDQNIIYYLEKRTQTNERVIVSQTPEGVKKDITQEPIDTSFHPYGGGVFVVKHETLIYRNTSYEIVKIHIASQKRTTFPSQPLCSYGDYDISQDCSLMFCLEKHKGHMSPVVFSNETKEKYTLLEEKGFFYASIKISPSLKKVAMIRWPIHQMPWQENELLVADFSLESKSLSNITSFKKGVYYDPQWHESETLYVCFEDDHSDMTLYTLKDFTHLVPLFKKELEVGSKKDQEAGGNEVGGIEVGRPHWIYGTSTYAITPNHDVLFSYVQKGIWNLGRYDTKTQTLFLDLLQAPHYIQNLKGSFDSNDIALVMGNPYEPLAPYRFSKEPSGFRPTLLDRSFPLPPSSCISAPLKEGLLQKDANPPCYGFLYEPKTSEALKDLEGFPSLFYSPTPVTKLRGVILRCHGGPQTQAEALFNLKIQFYTSRGFAYFDLNYRGSSGFGRAYRNLLEGQWGVSDVEDALYALQCLKTSYDVPFFLVGSSAGGFTVLNTLRRTSNVRAASCLFPVTDLCAFEHEEGAFEGYYNEMLVGPWETNQALYKERSPFYHSHEIQTPVMLCHGLQDTIVPYTQSQKLYEALKSQGQEAELYLIEKEGHGFSNPSNVLFQLHKEFEFFEKFL
jgi:pimeloyl-ACP methyl ester carboxylesterase